MAKFNLKALKSIFIAPGDISYNYINGRQESFWTPVILFFVANMIYFAVDKFDSDLYRHQNNMPYSVIAQEMIKKYERTHKMSSEKFEAEYIFHSHIVSKAALVLTVFIFSIALLVVNYRKGVRYIDHLAVSFEFMTLATLYILIIMAWINVQILSLIASFLLLYAFERMAYRWRPFRSMANAALLVFLFYATMLLFRSAVFFITILTM
jgi:hypothetical protein